MEKDKITNFRAWPIRESHRNIQVFLGFANFYRGFIKGFLMIVQPITATLSNSNEGKIFGPFMQITEMKEAF
jgi:hypothetical protein